MFSLTTIPDLIERSFFKHAESRIEDVVLSLVERDRCFVVFDSDNLFLSIGELNDVFDD